jgi:hypothetical protein
VILLLRPPRRISRKLRRSCAARGALEHAHAR